MIGRWPMVLSGVLTALAILAAYGWWQAFGVTLPVARSVFVGFEKTWLTLVFVALIVQVALSAIRWAAIEGAIEGPRPRFELGFVSGAIAMALGTVLPAPLMSVLCRSLATRIMGNGARRGAISGLLDQGCDLAISIWFAIPAVIAILIGDVAGFPMFALLVGIAGVPVALMLGWSVSCIVHARLTPRYDWLVRLGSPCNVIVLYLTSVMRVCNLVAMAALISLTSAAIDPVKLAIAVPIVAVTNALAMLPGSIGVSEWGFSSVLAEVGVADSAIIVFLLANRAILTGLPVLLGVIVAVGCGTRCWWLGGAQAGHITA